MEQGARPGLVFSIAPSLIANSCAVGRLRLDALLVRNYPLEVGVVVGKCSLSSGFPVLIVCRNSRLVRPIQRGF